MRTRTPHGTTLGAIRRQRHMTQGALAGALGCSLSFITTFVDKGKIAPNHPLVPKIAQTLGLTEQAVRALCRKPAMNKTQLGQSRAKLTNGNPDSMKTWGQRRAERLRALRAEKAQANHAVTNHAVANHAVVRTSKTSVAASATVTNRTNGTKNGTSLLARAGVDKDTRDAARLLTLATNSAHMQGSKEFEVTIPTSGMAHLLADWFRSKGIAEIDISVDELLHA
ncbi:MAG TPA: helix-turn-helix transcriptional regulator [Gemmatimonadaceae bacterium]|jgi:DNA-binding XRE family transcriptional regulator